MPRTKSAEAPAWKLKEPLPWGKLWWKDWLAEVALRDLTHDQRSRFLDVWAKTLGTDTPGTMTESDVRSWAGYTKPDWRAARCDFAPLFKIRGKQWVRESIARDHESSLESARLAYEKAMLGVAARRARKDLDTTGGTPGAPEEQPQVEPGVAPQVEPGLNEPEVRSQTSEARTRKGKPDSDSDSRSSASTQSALRAGLAGTAGSSGPSPLAGVVRRALGKGLSEGRRA